MPLKRTPPSATESPVSHKKQHQHVSDHSSLLTTEPEHSSNVMVPQSCGKQKRDRFLKRKHEDLDEVTKSDVLDMFQKLREDQDARFSVLLQSNNEIKAAMDFMSAKYDEMVQKVQAVENENKSLHKRLQTLESQNELLNRSLRCTSIKIRNIPNMVEETKDTLRNLIKDIAGTLTIPMKDLEIKDIYRINTKSSIKPIIVDFTTVTTRDHFISSYKKFNRDNKERLGSTNLNISGNNKPIYISENLVQKDRRLFYSARLFAKTYKYSFCWISHGKIYVKKGEGEQPIRINNDYDIEQLKT